MWGGFSRGVIFFVFRNSVEKLCVFWAQSFSVDLPEAKR